VVESIGINPLKSEVNCGESGLGIRMFAPIIALSNKRIIINGEGSLLKRPMDFFDKIFPVLSVDIESVNGFLPLALKGPLKPVDIEVDGSLSSQFLTGLLMAYSAAGANDVTINVKNLKSRPYIDLTLKVMQAFGMKLPVNDSYKKFYFEKAVHTKTVEKPVYTVEGDWSGGAFLLVAGALAGNIDIIGLDINSVQADKAVLKALEDAATGIRYEDGHIFINQRASKPFVFDATDCPDLFPPLVALAAGCKGQSRIKGVHRLTHKESNRAQSLHSEFAKLGCTIQFEDDVMVINGTGTIKPSYELHSHHDHRIAMACAVAGLIAEDLVQIRDAEAINKSYPGFYADLEKLGTKVQYENA
jgi:3-phosphoshikimate 1-carboxyvinyltransferase